MISDNDALQYIFNICDMLLFQSYTSVDMNSPTRITKVLILITDPGHVSMLTLSSTEFPGFLLSNSSSSSSSSLLNVSSSVNQKKGLKALNFYQHLNNNESFC